MFKCSPVYYANELATADIVINQGGTDSGKTYAIMQLIFKLAVFWKRSIHEPEMLITVVGESVPNLKKGAYRLAKQIFNDTPYLQRQLLSWNETDRMIIFKNGAVIEFTSYLTEQQAKQGKRQYAFFNEAQSISWPIFWQIAKRTRIRTFIDYNPTAPFWAHDQLIGTTPETNELSATVKLIISDHRHNPFLSEKDHRKTEGIKDPELWKVYARGKTGNLSGLIFPDWIKIPDEQYPWSDPFFAGLDFGYTNDPTASVKICRKHNSIYLHELFYEPGLAPTIINQTYLSHNFQEENTIYCEHDPDQVVQLQNQESNLSYEPARKGPGSIKAGILKLKEYKVYYTASSTNIDYERKRYMWKLNPDTGKPTNTPIDAFNHIIDAARYGVYTHYYREE